MWWVHLVTYTAIDWTFMCPQNPCVESWLPKVMALWGGASGRKLGHEAGAFVMRFVPHEERKRDARILRGRKEKVAFCMPGRASPRTQPGWPTDLGVPASRTKRSQRLLLESPHSILNFLPLQGQGILLEHPELTKTDTLVYFVMLARKVPPNKTTGNVKKIEA